MYGAVFPLVHTLAQGCQTYDSRTKTVRLYKSEKKLYTLITTNNIHICIKTKGGETWTYCHLQVTANEAVRGP